MLQLLLHATAECSVSVSVSHCEATQAESKVFYQKMKARMSVDCVDLNFAEVVQSVFDMCVGHVLEMLGTCFEPVSTRRHS